jgi:hypothetical protein
MESAMLLLLIVLVGVLTYLLFSPSKWLDKYAQEETEQWSKKQAEPVVEPVKPKKKKRKYKKRTRKPKP